MKKQPNKEVVLRLLINKNRSSTDSRVSITQNDIKNLELSVEEVKEALKFLSVDNCIRIIRIGNEEDFSTYWQLELTSMGIHYFEAKDNAKKEKLHKWIQFWIPVSISIAALLLAGASFYLDWLQLK